MKPYTLANKGKRLLEFMKYIENHDLVPSGKEFDAPLSEDSSFVEKLSVCTHKSNNGPPANYNGHILWRLNLNLQDIILDAGSISGLLSAIYLIISKLREGPLLEVVVESCHYGKDAIEVHLKLRKKGDISTSVESIQLMATTEDNYDYLLLLGSLHDLFKLRRFERPYAPDHPPPPSEISMPFLIDSAKTLILLASFGIDQETDISDRTRFALRIQCTHKTIIKKWVGEIDLLELW
jgi:hypothetical protein